MNVRAPNLMTEDTSLPRGGEHVSSGLRKAALLLHAASPADRGWLLDKLPEAERAQLAALVDEIGALGIPADPALLRDVVDLPKDLAAAFGGATAQPGSVAAHVDEAAHRLDVLDVLERAPAALLAQMLRDEPPGLLAALLDLHTWSWRNALLNQLGAAKRRHVEDLLANRHEADAAPALKAFLLASLAKRLEASLGARPDARPDARSDATRGAQPFDAAMAARSTVSAPASATTQGRRVWQRLLAWRRTSGSAA